MAQFINQQNLAAMLNPQTANLGQLIGAPLAQGIMASGQQDREDRLLGEQQQAHGPKIPRPDERQVAQIVCNGIVAEDGQVAILHGVKTNLRASSEQGDAPSEPWRPGRHGEGDHRAGLPMIFQPLPPWHSQRQNQGHNTP